VNRLVVQHDDRVVIAGSFTTINGAAYTNLARLSPNGGLDLTFHGNLIATDMAEVENGDLIVCAVLTPWDSTSRRFAVKRLDRDGNLIWQVNSDSIAPGVSQTPLLARDGTLLSIGSFTSTQGSIYTDVIRINPNGAVDSQFAALLEIPAKVQVLPVPQSDRVIAQGDFNRVNGRPKRFMVRLDKSGSIEEAFDIERGVSSKDTFSIQALTVQPDGKLIAEETVPSSLYLERLEPDGSPDPGFVRSKVIYTQDGSDTGAGWLESCFVDTLGRECIGLAENSHPKCHRGSSTSQAHLAG
jgi:Domain of unknown function (DUF5122) beta-propeller